jgi:hypothetical protein
MESTLGGVNIYLERTIQPAEEDGKEKNGRSLGPEHPLPPIAAAQVVHGANLDGARMGGLWAVV